MIWDTLAAIATAIGVAIAAWQIIKNGKLAQSSFEDSLDQQYRLLSKDIPVDALIGKPTPDAKRIETRELIYNYLDLCNEQIYLRKKSRVSRDTWEDWCSGIKENLQKVAFKEVWEEVKTEAPSSFTFLEYLEKRNFCGDPARWA